MPISKALQLRLSFCTLDDESEVTEEPEGSCVPAGSLDNCDNCLTGDQCAVGFCCPYMKKCVETSQTMCYLPIADCRSMCYDSYDPYACNCKNNDFPDNWAKPTC